MQTNDERQSWQDEVTGLVSKAMMVAVMTWEDKSFNKLGAREQAEVMAGLTKVFANKIISAVTSQFIDETSTS